MVTLLIRTSDEGTADMGSSSLDWSHACDCICAKVHVKRDDSL